MLGFFLDSWGGGWFFWLLVRMGTVRSEIVGFWGVGGEM